MEILALLNAEKTELMNILRMQDDKRVHLQALSVAKLDSTVDLMKLAAVVGAQRNELQVSLRVICIFRCLMCLQILADEIQTLKTKGLQRPKLQKMHGYEEVVEEEEMEIMELDETDDIIEVDFKFDKVPVPHFTIIKE